MLCFIYLPKVVTMYSHLLITVEVGKTWREGKNCQITKCGGWNRHEGWKIFMKSIDVEGGFYFVEGEIFQIIIYTTIGIHRCTFDVEIVSITTKPCVLQLFLFQWLCCKYLAWWHGHSHFWPQRSWRLLEAKNTAGRPKKAWKSWFIKKVFNRSFSTTSKTSYRIQSNLSYDLR